METHASATEVGPDERPLPDARTSGQADTPFRFSRMRPEELGGAVQLAPAVLEGLAEAMARGGGGESGIPAGYTYLGQFIAHDLSFERSKTPLGTPVTRTALEQGRSPKLDLDTLYGDGPRGDHKKFYESDGVHLKVGFAVGENGEERSGLDLPRNGGDPPIATIPDSRNDENLAVAQTHLAFIRFHNAVVDDLQQQEDPPADLFAAARAEVTHHYQWMIRDDYLAKICQAAVVEDVFDGSGRKLFEVGAQQRVIPTMPIEFSVAAFRFGHSMLRTNYRWNDALDGGLISVTRLFELTGEGGALDGLQGIPSAAVADFRRLFDFDAQPLTSLGTVGTENLNKAMRIDTALITRLGTMPEVVLDEDAAAAGGALRTNLAYRDLTRARDLGLATGQQMASFLEQRKVRPFTPLTPKAIETGDNGAQITGLGAGPVAEIVKNTPLWFYILREAETNGGTLTGVGARIVTEVIHRAMEASDASILRDTDWRPRYGPDASTFRMTDLLVKAFGDSHLKNPLGP
jgi:hypothetical protein